MSQISTGGDGIQPQAFDDFIIEEGGVINQVEWLGVYCKQGFTDRIPPTATSFKITFYSGDERPGSQLFTESIDVGVTDETVQRTVLANCGPERSAFTFYAYSARLAGEFVAEPGQKYWISIQAITPSLGTVWFWQNTNAAFDSLTVFGGQYTEHGRGTAFRLITDSPQG